MVALIPLGGAFRDVITAAGQGFVLCLFYRLLRFIFGDNKKAVFLCDIILLCTAGIFYRSAAAGIFEGGTMRWYTMLSLILSCYICNIIISIHIIKLSNFIKTKILFALFLRAKIIIMPFFKFFMPKFQYLAQKLRFVFNRKVKKRKRHLQNTGKMLYNS